MSQKLKLWQVAVLSLHWCDTPPTTLRYVHFFQTIVSTTGLIPLTLTNLPLSKQIFLLSKIKLISQQFHREKFKFFTNSMLSDVMCERNIVKIKFAVSKRTGTKMYLKRTEMYPVLSYKICTRKLNTETIETFIMIQFL